MLTTSATTTLPELFTHGVAFLLVEFTIAIAIELFHELFAGRLAPITATPSPLTFSITTSTARNGFELLGSQQ